MTLSGGLECFLLGLGMAWGSAWGSWPLPGVFGGLPSAPWAQGSVVKGLLVLSFSRRPLSTGNHDGFGCFSSPSLGPRVASPPCQRSSSLQRCP